MSELNQRLKQLAIAAQQHPPKSQNRQLALNELINLLRQSGQLCRPYQGQFSGLHQEIYAEALQRLFLHVCERIDSYNPEREVLQWTNFLLKKRFFIEASRELMITASKEVKRRNLDELDKSMPDKINSHVTPLISQEVIQCLEEDPEGIFQASHVVNFPEANFKFLAQQLIAGYTWKEISMELGVGIPTLSSFYQRSLTKFADKFREYLL